MMLGALWTLYQLVLVAIAAVAVYLWWRDGMWWYGELPTHGMLLAAGFALAGFVFSALMRATRSKQRKETQHESGSRGHAR